jgi:hypothetical protein
MAELSLLEDALAQLDQLFLLVIVVRPEVPHLSPRHSTPRKRCSGLPHVPPSPSVNLTPLGALRLCLALSNPCLRSFKPQRTLTSVQRIVQVLPLWLCFYVAGLAASLPSFSAPSCSSLQGEFNSGKSSVINALLGAKYLKDGVVPTTNEITLLQHVGDGHAEGSERSERHPDGHVLRYLPAPLLTQVWCCLVSIMKRGKGSAFLIRFVSQLERLFSMACRSSEYSGGSRRPILCACSRVYSNSRVSCY